MEEGNSLDFPSTLPCPQPDPDPEPEPEPEPGDDPAAENAGMDATWLANSLAKVRAQSEISERAIQKILDVFIPNLRVISGLVEEGIITKSYRHSIKPKSSCSHPPVRCSVKIQKRNRDGTEEIFTLADLSNVPARYVGNEINGVILLRQSAYVKLCDLKHHFAAMHPYITGEPLKVCYRHAHVGIDGVRETKSGSRSLIVVSVMIAGCICCWKVINYLHSLPEAKPTVEDLLR